MNPTPKYLVLLTASALMLGGCDKLGSFFGDAKEKGSEFVQSIEAKTDGGSVGMLLPDFTKLVEQEGPSVVNIQATKNAPAASARSACPAMTRAGASIRCWGSRGGWGEVGQADAWPLPMRQ